MTGSEATRTDPVCGGDVSIDFIVSRYVVPNGYMCILRSIA